MPPQEASAQPAAVTAVVVPVREAGLALRVQFLRRCWPFDNGKMLIV